MSAPPPGHRVASAELREGPWLNRLARCTSPYLRQHAHNPVDWHPWGDEALALARETDRPIFLSVGYAACHWCHVMERESFMDPGVAAMLNERFVPIKVDREERPDVDGQAMDALLALTGEGGWPLSLWMSPDGAPLYGGTYFPPHPRFGLPSFREALRRVDESWRESRARSLILAEALRERLRAESAPQRGELPGIDRVQAGVDRLLHEYDWRCGGWGMGAKFPQAPRLDLLIHAAARRQHPRAAEALRHALGALDRGGVHDHLGGGFHRYAVDEDWEVPHFEKMLYDNAQLARVFLRAASLTGDRRLGTVGARTLEYMLAELRAPEGAFWSSQDADDAGGEGAYYTWTPEELRQVVPEHAERLGRAYGVVPGGNMEGGRSVLRRQQEGDLLSALRPRLLAARQRRPKPATDDKIVLGWNGLALSAMAHGARVLGDARYLEAATRAAAQLLSACGLEQGATLPRTLGPDSPDGVLDDHALLAEGLLDLYEASGEPRWLLAASALAGQMLARFRDPETGALLLAPPRPPALPRVVFEEGAEPSGAGVAILVLLRLHALGDEGVTTEILDGALGSASPLLARSPAAAPTTLRALDLAAGHLRTLVIPGDPRDPEVAALRQAALQPWRPDLLVASLPPDAELSRFGAFTGKRSARRAYVCEGTSCAPPVSDPAALRAMLDAPGR